MTDRAEDDRRKAALAEDGAALPSRRTRADFFSGGPLRTAVKLGIASVIVGLFLSFLGLDPVEFWRGVWRLVSGLVSMLGDTAVEIIRNLATYLLFGAAIVVPVWIAVRILNGRRR